MKYQRSPADQPLRQCEILTDLYVHSLSLDSVPPGSETLVLPTHHPYAIILSQDCDLEQDYRTRFGQRVKDDKLLPTIIFCEVTTAESLFQRGGIDARIWERIKKNKDERYQFIEAVPAEHDALAQGLPELGIDFKRYFTLATAEVYERLKYQARRRTIMNSPYLEHLSTRFCYFQMRIALPEDHTSE